MWRADLLTNHSSIPEMNKRILSIRNVRTGCVTCPMDTAHLIPMVKRPESEANHSFPPRTEVRTTQLQLINIIIRYLLLLLLLCHGTENASNKKKTHSSKYHVMQSNGQYRCVVKLSRVFWDVTPCHFVNISSWTARSLKMEALISFETFWHSNPATQRHLPHSPQPHNVTPLI